MKSFAKLLVLLLAHCSLVFAQPQPGSPDLTFNPTDIGLGIGDGPNWTLHKAVTQPDGKIIIAGDFNSYNFVSRGHVARLNTDGTLDETFNPGTGANFVVYAVALQPDGKIIIGGAFNTYNGTTRKYIARLNPDGSLDTSFDPGVSVNADLGIFNITIQPDGKIIITGFFTTYVGVSRYCIARLNTDGTLDTSFIPGRFTRNDNTVVSLGPATLQPDGKMLITGSFNKYDGVVRNNIARLNSDGTLDTSFDPGSGANSGVGPPVLQPDGKIVIAGSFSSVNGTPRNTIARLHTDGTLDMTFNPGTGISGTTINPGIRAVTRQSDGKILIVGYFSYNNNTASNMARLNTDGAFDTSFNPGTGPDVPGSMCIQSDGKIIIAGDLTSYNGVTKNRIARVNTNGSVDVAFNISTGVTGSVLTTAVQPDGKILIGGKFTSYNGAPRKNIARLNRDGSLDNTFNPGTGADRDINAIAIQSDGKILIAGTFTTYNEIRKENICRLNADGSYDATFNTLIGGPDGPNGGVYAMVLQPDGKILIAGSFTAYNGVLANRLVRLNTDGKIDQTFNRSIGGANNFIWAMALQPDGKIIIGGEFKTYAGSARIRVARVNADGTLDDSFNPGGGVTDVPGNTFPPPRTIVNAIALQPDGKIIIGGKFNTYNGTTRNGITRLNTDGTLDTDFQSGAEPGKKISAIAVQHNGKLVIGGEFNTYSQTSRRYIAALNADGSLDNTFNTGAGADSWVQTILAFPNGHILVGGLFSSYNGTGRNRITRINGYMILANQIITFDPLADKIVGDVPFALTATATSGLPVSYVSSNTNVATISGNMVTIAGPGTTTITASQPGDNTYHAAAVVTQVLTVNSSVTLPNVYVTSPADDAIRVARTVNITSRLITNAINYTIQLSPTADFSSAVLEKSGSRSQQFTGLAYGTKYYARVKTNLDPFFGKVTTFTTVTAESFAYVATPKDNAVNQQTSVNVSSNVVADAAVYTIELNTMPDFSGASIVKTGSRTQNFSGLNYGTTYYSRVKTELTDNWGARRSFATIGAASLAFVTAPKDGAVNQKTTLTVSSNPVPGATQYTIELNTAPDFSGEALVKTGGLRQSFSGLSYSTTYYSRVKTEFTDDWGATRSFATIDAAGLSFITAPKNGAVNQSTTLNISCNPVPGATQYTIELNTAPDFSGVSVVKTAGLRQSFSGLSYSTTYYSRVKTEFTDDWGATRSFATIDAASLSFITAPKNEAVNQSTTLNISCNPVPGATQYTIELNTAPDFSGASVVKTGGLRQIFSSLSYSTTYYSRVKTEFTDDWGATRSFTTVDAASLAFVTAPKNGAVNQKTALNVSSNAVPGATSYTIELNTSPSFDGTSFVSTGASGIQNFSGLSQSTTYYTRVSTSLTPDQWGATRSFTTTTGSASARKKLTGDKTDDVSFEDKVAIESEADIELYPNPFEHTTHLFIPGKDREPVVLIVFDMTGREITRMEKNTNEWIEWGNEQGPGSYMLHVSKRDGWARLRVVKK